jgi:beta-glucanase (GH16 family)
LISVAVALAAVVVVVLTKPSAVRPPSTTPRHTNLHLVFNSNFDGTRLDNALWGTCYPWMDGPRGCTNFGNPEYEWYLPSQVQISRGVLDLVAQRKPTLGENVNGHPEEYVCRSGMVTTYPGFRFEYGYVRVVARLPKTEGLWSALWLSASNLRWPPEIDLIEYWGRRTHSAAVYFHPLGGVRLQAFPGVGNLSSGWHTFALDWTPTQLTWFIDGQEVLSTRQHIPHQSMYFIADLAYTSTNPVIIKSGSGCHGTLAVKSVEVWRQ